MTSTERDESRRTWAETHKPSRLEAANDRGYDPGERDHPAPAHLTLGEWEPLLDAAVREAREVHRAASEQWEAEQEIRRERAREWNE